ncbi:hypothetical protein GCM10010517_69870 [Streptosporangium fragile]|uniref:HTH cro/C1-type domain-containing protein n=1 Tax=Streptosporangium fragile TaxID=46186 RepID=A0ABN3W7K2_9ACTN
MQWERPGGPHATARYGDADVQAEEPETSPGARLRRLRVERGLSLNELSRLTHYSKGYLSKIETEEKTLTPGVARRCDEALQTGGELTDLVVRVAEVCPYRGLSAYGPRDSRWFFGRDRAVGVLVGWLAERLHGREHGPLAVVAPSGAGKSSLLRAGLLPAIGRGALPAAGSRTWPVVVCTPGARPVGELLARLGVVTGLAVPALAQALAEDPAAFAAQVRTGLTCRYRPDRPGEDAATGAPAAPRRLVLVVDQLEEIFTLCGDPAERRAFLTAVHALAAGPPSGDPARGAAALVVLGVRADFYGRCLAYPDLVASLRTGQLPLGPMSLPELREVITGPARAAGLTLEPGLVELLLRDMGVPAEPAGPETDPVHEPGALPLLSHALLSTWQQRRGDTLTVEGYRLTGGIGGAVAATAEGVFTRLDPHRQEIARRVLLHMVCVGEDDTETRRPVDIRHLPDAHFPPEATAEVIESFVRARLLTLDADHVQLAHEALLRAWPRLREWILADRAGLRVHRELAEAARGWEREGRDPSLLYRGARLRAAHEWAASAPAALTVVEQRFLDAGLAARAAEQAAARRRARHRRHLTATLTALLVLAVAAGVFAVRQRDFALSQRAEALSRQLATQSELLTGDPATSARLAAAAWRLAPTAEARAGMASLLRRPDRAVIPGSVSAVAFSPDGRTLAGAADDGTVRLWDVATRRAAGAPLTVHRRGAQSVAFSPDGRTLAGVGGGTVRLWDVTTRRAVGHPLTGQDSWVVSVAFSPDGRTLAGASHDETVRLWEVATGRAAGAPLTGHRKGVRSVAFSPDGRTLAGAADDGTVRLWEVTARRPIGHPLAGHRGGVRSVAFSPDGRTLAGAADDGTVRLWDVAARRPAGAPLAGHESRVTSVAYSPDGRTLASASHDGTVRLWDVAARRPVGTPLAGHEGSVTSVAYSPDGRTVASASHDGTVRLWDVATRRPAGAPLTGHDGPVIRVAFSPDGRVLASAGEDRTVRLWDVAARRPAGAPLTGHDGPVMGVAFSPDGRTLVSASHLATVRLWDVATRRPIGTLPDNHDGYLWSMAFSPDGRVLAGAGEDGTVRLWEVTARRPVGTPLAGHRGGVRSVAFSPDGRVLAGAGEDGTVRLWDVATRRPIGHPLAGHEDMTISVVFSPDGRTLASASHDGTARLWDVATGRAVGAPLAGHRGGVRSVAFSPDGRVLVSAGEDKTVLSWDVVPPGDLLTSLCAIAGRSFTPQEWSRYVPGEKYQPVCPP